MSFRKQGINQYILHDTDVENMFITEYMAKAPGDAVKTYLYGLMYANLNMPCENEEVAKALGIGLNGVLAAWDYWESEGVVRKLYKPGSETAYDIEFVSIKEMVLGGMPAPVPSARAVSMTDTDLSKLYQDVADLCGGFPDSRELQTIASWITDYNMSPELIVTGYKYCKEKKRSLRASYVFKVLKDWNDNNLSTEKEVREYLAESDRRFGLYKHIFAALGFSRNPSAAEKEIMNSWVDDMGFSEDKILEACAKTSGISNPNINYVNSILRNWYKEDKKPQGANLNLILAEVSRLYQEDREKNEAKTAENQHLVFTRVPRIGDIIKELRDCSFRMSRAMFMGGSGKASVEAEKEKIRQLNAEKDRLLIENGFGAHALDPVYTCSKCKDTGEQEDGTRCSCFNDKVAIAQANLGRN